MEKHNGPELGIPVYSNAELYEKDLLKGQKILIVMLWDCMMNPNESIYIQPKYINEPATPGSQCIKSAVDYYGISLTIVQNYEDAIHELTKQTTAGFCDYYATWVFCGPPFCVLPDCRSDPNLVGQFNDVLIQFWKKGGSLVFWAASEPLHYQVNLFLETVTFTHEAEAANGKTSLRIGGCHRGGNCLQGDASDVLEKTQTFSKSHHMFAQLNRSSLSHSIESLFEGTSNSYAEYDLEMIKPFKPFARDSEGGIMSLFYPANADAGTGDIIIDCCYARLFGQMTNDVFRYVQNIAGWTARPEIHLARDNVNPKDWRPASIQYTIQRGIRWNGFNA